MMTTTEAREELARRCEGAAAGSIGEAIDYLYSWDTDSVLADLLGAADLPRPASREGAQRLFSALTSISMT